MFDECLFLNVLTVLVVSAHIYWFYRKWMQGSQFTKDTRIDGKVVVITGGNAGIGLMTAIELANRGGKIYIACRSIQRGEEALVEIIQKSKSKNVYFIQLDLASMKSIRKFVDEFRKKEDKLDILINNAGVFCCPKSVTEDGFETQFGVNHLGHFLLTNLLLELIRKSAPARIVNVSSELSHHGRINKSDLMSLHNYNSYTAYNNSKLANVLFTKELVRRYANDGVSSFSLHPGVVATGAFRHVASKFSVIEPVVHLFSYLFFATPEAGMQTTLYCALEPGIEEQSGGYFSDCAIAEPNILAEDEELAKWLWNESEKLVQL